jgi:hypothetical protein
MKHYTRCFDRMKVGITQPAKLASLPAFQNRAVMTLAAISVAAKSTNKNPWVLEKP